MRVPSPAPVRGLLRCLDASFFIPSFEEEGYRTVGDLRSDGLDALWDFVKALGMPRGSDERLLALAFQVDDEGAAAVEADELTQCGVLLSGPWLEAVAPLYCQHMGCENMGPLLYSLLRFTKPKCCLEIGAGYSSAFLLQALEDNAKELAHWAQRPGTEGWLTAAVASEEGVLHCVDNFAHELSTAPRLLQVARRLGLERRLFLHLDDARAFVEEAEEQFEFVWLDGVLDFAPPIRNDVRAGVDGFLALLWPKVTPGGLVLLHSTLTNEAMRAWVDALPESRWGRSALSLLEPHKRFQNSVTLLQRRPEGYAEPIYSKLP